MLRVLHFSAAIHRYDVVDTIIARLDRSRFELLAVTGTRSSTPASYPEHERYPTECLDIPFRPKTYPVMLRSLARAAARFRPDILHAHGFDENVVAAVFARTGRVPCYIIGRHYSDHVYHLTRGAKRSFYLAVEGFCNRAACRINVPSHEVQELLWRQGVPREKVALVPFGLDFAKYRTSSPAAPARIRESLGAGATHIALACCRLSPEKGLEYLMQALPGILREYPGFRLVIAGRGPLEDSLRQLSRDLGVGAFVRFVGWREDAMDYVAASDLVVQPSFCESFCQTLMEALAFAKPVIMTPVGAAPEVIGDNERGRLITPGNPHAIEEAVRELLANPALARQMGEAGRSYIHRHMNADAAARRFEQLYGEALAAAMPSRSSVAA